MVRLLAVLAACAFLAGCGSRVYELRLEETKKYFAFLQRQNDLLDKPWRDPDSGIELRAPKQLKLLPGPSGPPAGEGSDGAAIRDPRQPDYVELELPGLAGAWMGLVAANVDGLESSVPCYFYVLSNQQLLRQTGASQEAAEFQDEVVSRITAALKVDPPTDNQWSSEQFPRGDSYVPKKEFHWIRLSPAEPIKNVPTDFYIYEHQSGNVRVSLVFVLPQQMNSSEPLNQAIPVCLETLNVPQDLPGASSGGGSTGGGGGGESKGRRGPGF